MAAKTLKDFFKEYRSGFNPITGEQNSFKDLTDEMIWNAAIKSVEENGSSHNTGGTPCQHSFFSSTEFGFVECKYCGETYPIEAQRAGA